MISALRDLSLDALHVVCPGVLRCEIGDRITTAPAAERFAPGDAAMMRAVLCGFLLAAAGASAQEMRPVLLEETAATSAGASLGDLDGDGDLDIVLAKGRHWPLRNLVLFNDGAGGFGARRALPGPADRTYTAALADLDGDGDLDLAVGNDRPDEKRLYSGDGAGGFRLTGTFGDPAWPTRNITAADLNGDRRPEIVVANRGGPENRSANHLCVNAGAAFSCEPFSGDSATTIAAGDLTGDGFADLFVPHRDGGQSFLFVNDSGRFGERRAVGPPRSATRAVTLGDLDGDARLDIVAGDEIGGGALLYRNLGGGAFAEPLRIGSPGDRVYSLAVADLDGDGDSDLVVGNAGSPGAILTNDDGGFRRRPFGDGEGAIYGLAVGDVNRDGAPDIVAARSDAPNVLYLGVRDSQASLPKRVMSSTSNQNSPKSASPRRER